MVTFRVLFGLLMFVSVIRFWSNGWIESQFIDPSFHFKYFGFYWVPELNAEATYLLFAIMAVSSLGIAFGAAYRVSAVLFFLSFSWVELLDATYYLNHYYFVSLVALIMVFLPAHRAHSLDVFLGLVNSRSKIPALGLNLIKFQLGLVYFMAGVAKLNADWLLEAMPLAIWLPAQSHLPVIGGLMTYTESAYIFSWAGALYDLLIPFVLLSSRFRWIGYGAVIIFHLLTWWFFQIGMFPFIMIGATLVFFSSDLHERIHRFVRWKYNPSENRVSRVKPISMSVMSAFVIFQLIFPFRHVFYPGNMYWTEEGYRFGWRVMLMEKAGHAQFRVRDTAGSEIWVDNGDFLNPVQEKMLSTQSDFMLQFADHLKEYYTDQGVEVEKVTADVFVTLNGRSSRRFIDPEVDLASLDDSWTHKSWILPLRSKG